MTKPIKFKKYGWIKDRPEVRDVRYNATILTESQIPSIVDLRPLCPPVFDQGQLGSCTANAIANAHLFDQMKQKDGDIFTPSRLFIYYNERAINNTINSDSGAALRDGIKTLNSIGVCPEAIWPYDVNKFTKKPSTVCYKNAEDHEVISYQSIDQNINAIKHCLAEGYPFVMGITIYESFESEEVAQTGTVNMPDPSESCLGGHAILVVGYNDTNQTITIMNSWGDSWGNKGFFTIPYSYITNPYLASDMWTIRAVKD